MCIRDRFEELELAAFGNRIPSLTFEVEADAGPVDAGSVANILPVSYTHLDVYKRQAPW